MRHQKKGKSLGRKKGPRKALLRSLATSLVIYEKINTTKVKAKVIRPVVEKLITLGKNDTVHHRRLVAKTLYLKGAVKKVFEVLGPRYKNRTGGYTRIVKLPPRVGDNAEVAMIEFIDRDKIVEKPASAKSSTKVSTKKIVKKSEKLVEPKNNVKQSKETKKLQTKVK